MRSIVVILSIFLMGLFAQAQDKKLPVKVKTVEKPIANTNFRPISYISPIKLARIYFHRNDRVKKELHFRLKRNRARLA